MTLKYENPNHRCYVKDHKHCWVCQEIVKESTFQFDDLACDTCYVNDLKATIEKLTIKRKNAKVCKES